MTTYRITYEIVIDDNDVKLCADAYGDTVDQWEEEMVDEMQYSITQNRLTEWTKAHGIKEPKLKKFNIQYIDYFDNHQVLEPLRKD